VPLDTRIPLMAQTYQPDFGEIAQTRAQGMNVLSQMRQRDQELAQQNALAEYYNRGGFKQDPTGALQFGAAGRDMLNAYNTNRQVNIQQDKATREAEQERLETQKKAYGTALMNVHADPSDANADMNFANLEVLGVDTSPYRQMLSQVKDPVERKKYLDDFLNTTEEGRTFLERYQSTPEMVDLGNRKIMAETNRNRSDFGKEIARYDVGVSPDQRSRESVERAKLEDKSAAVTAGGAGKPGSTTVTQDQAFYNVNRVLNNISALADLVEKDPKSVRAGMFESAAEATGAPGLANILRGSNRQIAAQSYDDIIDAILYLSTGAAYNKEQRAGMISAYRPNFTDKPEAINAKFDRILGLLDGAKARSGANWTPEIDNQYRAAVEKLRSATLNATKSKGGGAGQQAPSLPKAAIDNGVTPEIWSVMSEEDRALFAD
jgi:hypothetical protein